MVERKKAFKPMKQENGCYEFYPKVKFTENYDCINGKWILKADAKRGTCNPKSPFAKNPNYKCNPLSGHYKFIGKKPEEEKKPMTTFAKYVGEFKGKPILDSSGVKVPPTERMGVLGQKWAHLKEQDPELYETYQREYEAEKAIYEETHPKPEKVYKKGPSKYHIFVMQYRADHPGVTMPEVIAAWRIDHPAKK